MKFNETFMKVIKKDLRVGAVPMLLGEPGIGKSSWVMALGESLRTKVFVLACNQLADKSDLTGCRLVPDGNNGYENRFYPHTVINQAIKYAEEHPKETPILFLDELNRTTPDVTSEALSIPTLRSIGDKQLPENLKVITAGNDKGNITSLDSASITRFSLYHIEPDVDTYLSLDDELHPCIRSVLIKNRDLLFCKNIISCTDDSIDNDSEEDNGISIDAILDDGEVMQQMTTPRTITGLSKWLNQCQIDELGMFLQDTKHIDGQEVSTLQEIIEGHTGKTLFSIELLKEIATYIENTNIANVASTSISLTKPKSYDILISCNTVDELDEKVKSMSETEVSNALLYSLYDDRDNTKLITYLTNIVNSFTLDDKKKFIELCSKGKLDPINAKTFADTNSALAKTFECVLDMI